MREYNIVSRKETLYGLTSRVENLAYDFNKAKETRPEGYDLKQISYHGVYAILTFYRNRDRITEIWKKKY